MEQQFTREEFYDLIWSKPIKDLAPEFGMSDVALSKICRQLGLATPGRGYWAKLKAGTKLPPQPELPPRGFGEADTVTIGHTSWEERQERSALLDALPPRPEFHESLAELADRARAAVGHTSLAKSLAGSHPAVAALLRDDELRREKSKNSSYSWEHREYFCSPFEKRRLRIVNAIFIGIEKVGLRGSIIGKNPQEFRVTARRGIELTFKLDDPAYKERQSYLPTSAANRPATDKLRFEIDWGLNPVPGLQLVWEDGANYQIDQDIKDIAIGLVIAIEMAFRTWKIQRHEYAIEDREKRIREQKAAKEAAAELEKQRLDRSRKAQLDKLFSDAAAYRLAKDLREYVAEVLSANESDEHPVSDKDLQAWAAWAREQADSIDPVKSRAFLGKAPEPIEGGDETVSKTQTAQSANPNQPNSYQSAEWHPNRWYTKLHNT